MKWELLRETCTTVCANKWHFYDNFFKGFVFLTFNTDMCKTTVELTSSRFSQDNSNTERVSFVTTKIELPEQVMVIAISVTHGWCTMHTSLWGRSGKIKPFLLHAHNPCLQVGDKRRRTEIINLWPITCTIRNVSICDVAPVEKLHSHGLNAIGTSQILPLAR